MLRTITLTLILKGWHYIYLEALFQSTVYADYFKQLIFELFKFNGFLILQTNLDSKI